MTDHHPEPICTVSLDDLPRLLAAVATDRSDAADDADDADDDLYDDLSVDVPALLRGVTAALAAPGPPLTIGHIVDEALFTRCITGDARTPVRAWALDEVRALLEGDGRFVVAGNVVQLRATSGGGEAVRPAARAA